MFNYDICKKKIIFLFSKKSNQNNKLRFSIYSSFDIAKVDRYGRPVAPQTAENALKRFYEIEDESDNEEEEKTLEELERELAEDEENMEDEKIPIVKPRGLKYDPMRGQGIIDSSDEEVTDEEESDQEEPEAEVNRNIGSIIQKATFQVKRHLIN